MTVFIKTKPISKKSVMKENRFMRTLSVQYMLPNLKIMGIRVEELGIPLTVFDNPMTLIPAKEMDRWFERLIEQSKDPDIVLSACTDIELSKWGCWVGGFSLAMTWP